MQIPFFPLVAWLISILWYITDLTFHVCSKSMGWHSK